MIDQLYAEDAAFLADEPGDPPVERHGRDEIMSNITEVNQRLTQGAGLATTGTGVAANHDLLRVSWRMTTADGTVAVTGMNLLVRNSAGLIVSDHIFIGSRGGRPAVADRQPAWPTSSASSRRVR